MSAPRLRIHVISETEYIMKGQGVHTAFIDCVDILKSGSDVDCVVNQEGWGDVLHAHSYGPYFFWKGLRRRYRGKKILTVHVIPDSIKGSLPAWRLLMPFVRWYFRLVYSFADHCIAISPMVEEAIASLKSKDPGRPHQQSDSCREVPPRGPETGCRAEVAERTRKCLCDIGRRPA